MSTTPSAPSTSKDDIEAAMTTGAYESSEREQGVIEKYTVRRNDDPTGKHDACWFFVLDIRHDPLARVALAAYVDAARRAGFEVLAADLARRLAPSPEVEDWLVRNTDWTPDDDWREYGPQTLTAAARDEQGASDV